LYHVDGGIPLFVCVDEVIMDHIDQRFSMISVICLGCLVVVGNHRV